jgi:hypothetical protein
VAQTDTNQAGMPRINLYETMTPKNYHTAASSETLMALKWNKTTSGQPKTAQKQPRNDPKQSHDGSKWPKRTPAHPIASK